VAKNVSRRRVLGAGLAIGAGAAGSAVLGGTAHADTGTSGAASSTSTALSSVDVVVVGAGLAGLTAARNLVAGGKSVIVLEARDRVGGRVYDIKLNNGGTMEAGGQFTGPTQDHLQALASSLGVSTFTGYNTGNSIFYTNGTVIPYSGPLPPLDAATTQALYTAIGTLDSLAASVPVNAPWTAPNAEAYDGETVASWIAANVTNTTVQSILSLMVTGALSAEARDVSMLWWLYYIAASGNEGNVGTLERLTGTIGGARDSRFVGGPQQIALKIAAALGKRVVLNAPVRRIQQLTANSTLVVSDTCSYLAKSVVVSTPVTLASRISYSPPLPAQRDQLTQRFPMSSIGKAIAIYPTPFWRAAGFNGQVASDSGTAKSTFDNSPPSASYGAMLAFLDGDNMRGVENLTDAAIQALVLKDLTNYFGPQAANPTQFILRRWDSEEFTRGGAPAFTGPGVLTRYGVAIRPADGNIHWAGAETSAYWAGHMEGAVRSGERAASEILG
jgi:monoamine oxidase